MWKELTTLKDSAHIWVCSEHLLTGLLWWSHSVVANSRQTQHLAITSRHRCWSSFHLQEGPTQKSAKSSFLCSTWLNAGCTPDPPSLPSPLRGLSAPVMPRCWEKPQSQVSSLSQYFPSLYYNNWLCQIIKNREVWGGSVCRFGYQLVKDSKWSTLQVCKKIRWKSLFFFRRRRCITGFSPSCKRQLFTKL